MTYILDRVLRADSETVATIGTVRFPFLAGEDQREMFYGIYERDTVSLMREWLGPGDVVLDVGANVGYLTAVAADCVGPAGEVHAFEPEPSHFSRLERLAALNRHLRIVVNPAAVGEQDGSVDLLVSTEAGWHTTVPGFNRQLGYRSRVRVPVRCLDSYLAEHRLGQDRPVRLVKVDVEGAESAVLRGARNVLGRRLVDAFLVEVTPPSSEHTCEPLSPMFRQMGEAGYVAVARRGDCREWVKADAEGMTRQTMIFWALAERTRAKGSRNHEP